MGTIEKKTWIPFYDEIQKGIKTFDIRLGNSEIKEGDIIIFREYDQVKKEYTGRKTSKLVTYRLIQKENEFGDDKSQFFTKEEIEKHGIVTFAIKDYLDKELSSDEEFFDGIIQEIKELRQRKNSDYGAAWKKMRQIGITDTISNKMERVKSFENKGELNFESIEDSYKDSINYCLFGLRKLYQTKQNQK